MDFSSNWFCQSLRGMPVIMDGPVRACVHMLNSRPQLTSIKQLQGSFTTHSVCAAHRYSCCPLQFVSIMVQSLSLLKCPSLSSFTFSSIPSCPARSPSCFLILSVISVCLIHPSTSPSSSTFPPHVTQSLGLFNNTLLQQNPAIQASCCPEQTQHCKHSSPECIYLY